MGYLVRSATDFVLQHKPKLNPPVSTRPKLNLRVDPPPKPNPRVDIPPDPPVRFVAGLAVLSGAAVVLRIGSWIGSRGNFGRGLFLGGSLVLVAYLGRVGVSLGGRGQASFPHRSQPGRGRRANSSK